MNGLAYPSSSPQFCTPIQSEGIHEINPAPLTRLRHSARACPVLLRRFWPMFPTCQRTTALMCWLSPLAPTPPPLTHPRYPSTARASSEARLRPTTPLLPPITVHSGFTASKVFGCVALLDTGSPHTFIRRDVLGHMLAGGAAALVSSRALPVVPYGGFGKSALLRTSTSVRLSVQFFRAEQPTSSFAVWACVVPPSVMQHAVLLGCDSWMRFNTRSNRSFPPRPSDQSWSSFPLQVCNGSHTWPCRSGRRRQFAAYTQG